MHRRAGNEQLLSCLLFWQDVTEYGAAEDRSADRLLRLCHAWMIYNKYLSEDSPYKVGMYTKRNVACDQFRFVYNLNNFCIHFF